MRDLSRLLKPRSIAVYGSKWAENVIHACDRFGFQGDVWPVHPSRPEIAGRPAFASIADLPEAPDAVFLGVNRDLTLSLLPDIRAAGAGGVICFASGFAERGDRGGQAALVTAAGEMPILGPNCYGLINALDGAVIWPDEQGCRPVERGVAIISQSSNIAMTLTMQRAGLPIAMMLCAGNAAQTGVAELAATALADERVTALGLYLEGLGDASAMASVVQAARRVGKGVVVLKSGRSPAARDAAASHTASLSGASEVSSAFLARIGAGEVASLPALVETLKVLNQFGPLDAPRLVSVSCSGGEAGLVGDAALSRRLHFPPLTDAACVKLSDALGPAIALANPLDYQTFVWGDEAATARVFTAALTDMDAGLYVIDPPRPDRCDPSGFVPAFDAMRSAAKSSRKPVFAVTTLPLSIEEDQIEALARDGVLVLNGIDTALEALEAASAPMQGDWHPWPAAHDASSEIVPESMAKQALAGAGLSVPRSVTAPSIADLDPAALSPPYVLKGLGVAHKTEVGAVLLGLASLDGLKPMKGAEGYLLEEMVSVIRAEIMVGIRRDPVCGAVLTLGAGGVMAELIDDTATLICPVTADEIEAALRGLKIGRVIKGWRGSKGGSFEPVVDAVMTLQRLMSEDTALCEVEVNPLALTDEGAIVLDALMRRTR